MTSFGPSNWDAALVHRQKKHGVDAFMVLDSSHSSNSTFGCDDPYGKKGMMTTITATGLGLDFGNVQGIQSGFGAPSELAVTAVSDMEEGVFRYQNGIDS